MTHLMARAKDESPDDRNKILLVVLVPALYIFAISLRIFFAVSSVISFVFRGCIFPVLFIGFLTMGVIAGSIFVIGELFLWIIEIIAPPKTITPSA